jgi:hypothetical protein
MRPVLAAHCSVQTHGRTRNSVQNVVSQFSWQAVKPRGHVHPLVECWPVMSFAHGRYTVAQAEFEVYAYA